MKRWVRFQIPRPPLWLALQSHKFSRRSFCCRYLSQLRLWSVSLRVIPNYCVRSCSYLLLVAGISVPVTRGQRSYSQHHTAPMSPSQPAPCWHHGCEVHTQTCGFFLHKSHAQVRTQIITCWILLSGRSGMTLRGEWCFLQQEELASLFMSLPRKGHCPLQCWEQLQSVSDT